MASVPSVASILAASSSLCEDQLAELVAGLQQLQKVAATKTSQASEEPSLPPGSASTPSTKPLHFLSLPQELRDIIYGYVLVPLSGRIAIQSQSNESDSNIDANILCTCKQIYAEASAVLYDKADLRVFVQSEHLPGRSGEINTPRTVCPEHQEDVREEFKAVTGKKVLESLGRPRQVLNRFRQLHVGVGFDQRLTVPSVFQDVRQFLADLLADDEAASNGIARRHIRLFTTMTRCPLQPIVHRSARPAAFIPLLAVIILQEVEDLVNLMKADIQKTHESVEWDTDVFIRAESPTGTVAIYFKHGETVDAQSPSSWTFQTWRPGTAKPNDGRRGYFDPRATMIYM